MSVTLLEIKAFASEQLERAKKFATRIQFTEKSAMSNTWLEESRSIRASISDDPEFSKLEYSEGRATWTSIMSIDLRDSTKLADQITPRNMYLTMHTLLPTLAYICEHSGGEVMNFRGDGLFAAFGLKKIDTTEDEPTSEEKLNANRDSVVCGLRLIQSISSAIEVVLSDDGIDVDLHAGVGIDCGHATVTRIGWMSAGELTAYGSCVNEACHLANGRDKVVVSGRVTDLYPSGEGGRLSFHPANGNGFLAQYGESLLV